MHRFGMLLLSLVLLAGLTAAAPVIGTQTPGCGPGLHTGRVDGRPYLLYVPESATTPAPTVVSYHGRLQTAMSQLRKTGLTNVADREGFIVVAPQALGGTWDFRGSDTEFTDHILDELTCDSPARTYASGMSMGSAMAFLQACAQPRRFAAFGGVGFEIYLPKCAEPDPVAIIAFHGTADQVVPFAGGFTASSATAPPAEATMREWAVRGGCQEYVSSVPTAGVTLRAWDKCLSGTQVQFYRIRGGKHVWPLGPGLDASTVMWEFFRQFTLE